MKQAKTICRVFLWLNLLQSVCSEDHRIQRRSDNADPKLQMTIGHNMNNSTSMKHGFEYRYTFTVKHSSESRSDARGVHVTWMLTPFLKFKKVDSSLMTGSLRVQQKDDSVTFLIDQILWAEEVQFNFTVIFDSDHSLKNGRHHIVTPVSLLYYKEYTDNGHVITKGTPFSSRLQTLSIEMTIPGCESALGMESGIIKDYQLTASSTYSFLQPYKARPGGDNDAWCAFIANDQQFIELDFTKKTRVTRIVTYGRSQKQHWVKRYLIQFSNNEVDWYNYTENGFDKLSIKLSSSLGFTRMAYAQSTN
ncbi:uncharacterized protein LOC111333840 [Stylophora pistillata]|uniref:uncharacterized protein LOC111333840 n=1 Tax=Stylophora pistillata TaxID=50429 RepID=UPI000C0413BF|nr:uncharacterized protein LOC111333840 [Stylophora pistillata]